jgi:hypothetical protein
MERYVRLIAGAFILTSPGLYFVSTWFLLMTASAGANLFQSGTTRWCLMEDFLGLFGVKKCDGPVRAQEDP